MGLPRWLRARLDVDGRAKVREWVAKQGFAISDGAGVSRGTGQSIESVEADLDKLVEIATWLRDGGDLVEDLARIARTDPLAEVAQEAIHALVRHQSSAAKLAFDSRWPGVRLAAAIACAGPESDQVLSDLVADKRAETQTRADALNTLGRTPDLVLAWPSDRISDLLNAEPELAITMAESLGKFGTVEQVPALFAAGNDGQSRAVRKAAKAAVEAIHARVGDQERGGLAIAEVSAGALTEVDE